MVPDKLVVHIGQIQHFDRAGAEIVEPESDDLARIDARVMIRYEVAVRAGREAILEADERSVLGCQIEHVHRVCREIGEIESCDRSEAGGNGIIVGDRVPVGAIMEATWKERAARDE